LPFARRFASVAALLLLTLGLTSRLSPPGEERPATIQDVYAQVVPGTRDIPEKGVVMKLAHDKPAPEPGPRARALTFRLPENYRSPQPYRRGLRLAGLPDGPRVDLSLEVRNEGKQSLVLQIGSERTQLRFDLQGPGTLTLFGQGSPQPFLRQGKVTLEPGEAYLLPIPHLIGGRPSQQQGVYWTAPGRYTLSVHYQVEVEEGGRNRELNVSTPPLSLDVQTR
jgi:hypothetical protein